MSKQAEVQVSFWTDKDLLKSIDDFVDIHGYKSRSKFIINSMMIVINNPILLKKIKVETELELLRKFLKAFLDYQKTGKMPSVNVTDEEDLIYRQLVKEVSA